MANQNPVFYNPSSTELPYYDHLFQTADVSKTGQINGRDAVTFLSKSKLPLDLLRNIWNIADQNPKTNQLDKSKFFIAVRLIQLAQNGITLPTDGSVVSGDLALIGGSDESMRAPFFEGVMMQQSQQQQSQSSTQAAIDSPPRSASNATQMSQTPAQNPQPTPTPTPQRADFQPTPSIQPVPSTPQQQQQQSQQPTPQTTTQTQLTHDPYSMTPSEKARYESLFPQYAKDDGYVYGKEAVELFTKSGMDKGLLRNIWNMVDQPVDNRLSKLEFAIAMHLIVCVSKKNLLMPSVLPASLKGLKDLEVGDAGGVGGKVTGGGSGGMGMGMGMGMGSGTMPGSIPSPNPSSPSGKTLASIEESQPSVSAISAAAAAPVAPQPASQFGTGMALGGMSISDAFDNMSTNDPSPAAESDTTPTTAGMLGMSLPQQTQAPAVNVQPIQPTQPVQPPQVGLMMQRPTSADVPSAAPTMSATPAVLSTTSTGETSVVSTEELKNLQSILQRMQAENVSLKAQLGQCSEEELSVRKEITNTVAEISSLSMELTTLRAQVADAKSSLIEATSELKAQIEKRDILRSLLEDAAATKKTIELGALKIKELEDVAKAAKSKSSQSPELESSKSRDPPTPYDQSFFSYEKANSGTMNDILQSQMSMEGPPSSPISHYDPSASGSYHDNQPTPARNTGPPQQMPPMPPAPPADPGMYYSQQQQQQQRTLPDPPVEDMQKLDELKFQAAQVERNAASASDQARAYAAHYEDLRAQAERAEIILNEKKPKKKGFFGSGKREAKKEIEQARQIAQVKTNEAQHAHLAMKKAEDDASKFKQEAQALRKKAEDFELEITKRASEQAEAQRAADLRVEEMRQMQNDSTVHSDFSYSNTSYAPPMGFGGFPGAQPPAAHPPQMNDRDIMGGNVGFGEGVTPTGYASSVGFTDHSVYSINNSVTGSTNHGTGALPTGYNSDAASHSVASESLLYPPVETTNNGGGSVTGALSIGSIAPAGSVPNAPTGYTGDTASRSVVSETMFPPTSENHSHTHTDGNSKPPLGANPEMTYTPHIDMTNNVAHPDISKTATSASNDTETMNNTTTSAQKNPTAAEANIESKSTQESNNESIHNIASNESSQFGSFQSPDFSGIPSPEKPNDEFMVPAMPTFPETTIQEEPKIEIHQQEQYAPTDPPEDKLRMVMSKESGDSIESKIVLGEEPNNKDVTLAVQSNELHATATVVAASVQTTSTELDNCRSGETGELETVYLTEDDPPANIHSEEKQDTNDGATNNDKTNATAQPTIDNGLIPSTNTTSQPTTNNGLIPSLDKESNSMAFGTITNNGLMPSFDNGLNNMTMGATTHDGLIPSPAKPTGKTMNEMTLGPAMSLGTDSEFPTTVLSNDNQSTIMGLPPMNNSALPPPPSTTATIPPSLGISPSADSSHFGIMSQSTDGGIPSPTQSTDEFDKVFM